MQTTQQQLYFGSMNLDRNRDRRMVFHGRVSTQHEQQKDALSNQMQWYDDQLKYHAKALPERLQKSVPLLCVCWTTPETENST